MSFGKNTTMPLKTKSYKDWLSAKLSDPLRAAGYLNAALEDSEAMFLKALRKVAMSQGRSMTEIAESCGVSRESIYRMLSESGNPTSENRRSILAALGMKSIVAPIRPNRTTISLESEAAHPGTIQGTPAGNSGSGGPNQSESLSVSWGITIGVPVRKGPMREWENSNSISKYQKPGLTQGRLAQGYTT
jgi:probable addiction module antidote protein